MSGTSGGPSLRDALDYAPAELAFGTSGLRGRVCDITNLEAYINTRAFLSFLLGRGEIRPGATVCAAGDLRPSTDTRVAGEGGRGEILQAVLRAVRDAGLLPLYLGKIPSPALLFCAMRRGAASIMVTGSHIPFDRNGIKFNRSRGEVLKADEEPILAAVRRVREEEYRRPAAESPFGPDGMLTPGERQPLPAPAPGAAEEYARRYREAFPPGVLAGRRILVWQHSAVGRDILVELLRSLGAQVIPAGRSLSFVPVDTEAIGEDTLGEIQALVDSAGGPGVDAVVSTDGDSDRPLLLAVDRGRVRFIPGDILGAAAAVYLGAREAAVPVSANDAVDLHLARAGVRVVKTRIGSPHVIAAMRDVGWEANGGFLTARTLAVPGGGALEPLPTRDALLPLLAALYASLGAGLSVSALFDGMPRRFGASGLLRGFPRGSSSAIMADFPAPDRGVEEAELTGSGVRLRGSGGERLVPGADPLARAFTGTAARLQELFTAADGFAPVRWVNWVDGVRIGFEGGDIAHIRPSGNAPELRIYAAADTPERARAIVAAATRDGGILRRLQQAAETRSACAELTRHPAPVRLKGAPQNYPWGGLSLIPELAGEEAGGKPWAELWIGAHPKSPAVALLPSGEALAEVPLTALMELCPDAVLGTEAARRFGGRLPYLLKVLDARQMLSIQAHPTRKRAREGFARENAAGIPIDAPNRSYRDDNHKPELHCVLTDFWMLHGFRAPADISRTLGSIPELGAVLPGFPARLSAASSPDARRGVLAELYRTVMTMPQDRADRALSRLVQRLEREQPRDKDGPDFWALRASREFPLPGGHRDRGLFCIYLLNLLHLRPGQGTFQPAGTLHAYLEGATVEVMADSDNVLRGGLTPKHVDVPELLETLAFESGMPGILDGVAVSDTQSVYSAPVEEFMLSRITVGPGMPHASGPGHSVECLITLEGAAVLSGAGARLPLKRGGIVLVPAGIAYTFEAVEGRAVVFGAGIPPEGQA
jgi:phosphomannomutase